MSIHQAGCKPPEYVNHADSSVKAVVFIYRRGVWGCKWPSCAAVNYWRLHNSSLLAWTQHVCTACSLKWAGLHKTNKPHGLNISFVSLWTVSQVVGLSQIISVIRVVKSVSVSVPACVACALAHLNHHTPHPNDFERRIPWVNTLWRISAFSRRWRVDEGSVAYGGWRHVDSSVSSVAVQSVSKEPTKREGNGQRLEVCFMIGHKFT